MVRYGHAAASISPVRDRRMGPLRLSSRPVPVPRLRPATHACPSPAGALFADTLRGIDASRCTSYGRRRADSYLRDKSTRP